MSNSKKCTICLKTHEMQFFIFSKGDNLTGIGKVCMFCKEEEMQFQATKWRVEEVVNFLTGNFTKIENNGDWYSSLFESTYISFQYLKEPKCLYCGTDLTPKYVPEKYDIISTKAAIEHLDPKHLGGDFGPSNVALSCNICNSKKGAKFFHEWLKEIPIQRQNRVRIYYSQRRGIEPEEYQRSDIKVYMGPIVPNYDENRTLTILADVPEHLRGKQLEEIEKEHQKRLNQLQSILFKPSPTLPWGELLFDKSVISKIQTVLAKSSF